MKQEGSALLPNQQGLFQSFRSVKLFSFLISFILICVCFLGLGTFNQTLAATYYVDSSITDTNPASATPDCTNYNTGTFTCSGGAGSAYKTIADVNAKSFSPDDQVLFRKGQTWREQLTVPSSGTSGHPIIFGAFGSGNNPKITGADILSTSGWSKTGGYTNVYQKALVTDPGSYVLENSVLMSKQTSIANVDSNAGSYYWSSNTIYVNAFGGSKDPSSNGLTYETPIRATAINLSGNDYITIDHIDSEMSQATQLIAASGGDYLTMQNLTLKYGVLYLIRVGDGAKNNNQTFTNITFGRNNDRALLIHGDNVTVQNCSFAYNGGIEMRDIDNSHSQNFLIQNNSFSNTGSATGENGAILLDGDINGDNSDYHSGIIRYNSFSDILGRPIDGFYGDTLIYYNTFDNIQNGAAGSGIAIEVNGPDNKVLNNTINNVQNIGIMLNTNPMAPNVQSVVKNNIIVGLSANHLIWVTNDAGLSPTIDYNDYWDGTGSRSKFYWKGTDYTFADWKTNSSQDAHSMDSDPYLVGGSEAKPYAYFYPRSYSPVINAGVDVGLTKDYLNVNVPQGAAPDIGAFEYTVSVPENIWFFFPLFMVLPRLIFLLGSRQGRRLLFSLISKHEYKSLLIELYLSYLNLASYLLKRII